MYKKTTKILPGIKILLALILLILFSLLLSHIIGVQYGEEEKTVAFVIILSLFGGAYLTLNRLFLKKIKILIMNIILVVVGLYIFFTKISKICLIIFLLIWFLFLLLTIFDIFYFPEREYERKRNKGQL